MDRLTWQRIEAICAGALERNGDARARYVARMCDDDAALRREVDTLLAQVDEDPAFLEIPALGARGDEATPVIDRDEHVGTMIGVWRVQRELGEGGMGQVFLASRELDGIAQTVALKLVRAARRSPELLRRFDRERRTLAALEHPNIARFLDAGIAADGSPYVAMEFVDGDDIVHHCSARALALEDRLRLFLTVCDAVQHAHQRLVVHRDIKPSNVLVSADGAPKLLDFGIAKLLDQDTEDLTANTARLLTPGYAAPEQLEGAAITTATDVFALGVLLYELLAGRHPFRVRGMSDAELVRAVLNGQPLPPSAAAPKALALTWPTALRRDLDTIVLMALRHEPARRYASVGAMADDIRRSLSGLPVLARGDSAGYRLQLFLRRHRLAVSVSAVISVALVTVTAISLVQSRRVAAESARATRERDQALEVRGFLMEMFGATGADQAVGDTLTVRALLDKQRGRVDAMDSDRPLAKADMLEVLADGYDRLGYPLDAAPLANAALSLRRSTAEASPKDLAASLQLAGWIAHERGATADAERLLLESLALTRRVDNDGELESRTLNDLGVVFNATKRYDDAVRVLTEALSLRRARYGVTHRAVGITANNLAAAYFFRKQLPEAIRTQTLALESLRAAVGSDHQRTVVALANLAAFKRAQGDLDGAEADYRALAAQQSRLQGRAHPVTARVLSALAVVLDDRATKSTSRIVADSLRREADALYVEAIASLSARLGASHPQVATTRARLEALRARRRTN